MERRVLITLDDREKQILHQAGEIMQMACHLAQQKCNECPFVKLCDDYLPEGDNIEDVAKYLLKI